MSRIVAAFGVRFYTGRMFPPGYRVSLVRMEGNRAASYEVFTDGWLQGGRAWGRPVDVQEMADGSLLVSDDMAGMIYRISYEGKSGLSGHQTGMSGRDA